MTLLEVKEPFIEKALTWVQNKGYSNIKSRIGEFDEPISFTQSSTNDSVTPDITAVSYGRKFYFEIGLKSDSPRQVVNKWKLLSQLASMKQGKLIIFTPHGHKAFATRLVEEHQITAEIMPL